MCIKAGRVTLAKEIDHIIALCNSGTNEDSNLQPLCIACHADKTRADKGQVELARYEGSRVVW
jgi:5-methylcytosine-specific restriction protein A